MARNEKIRVSSYERTRPTTKSKKKKADPAKLDPVNKPADIGTKILSRDDLKRRPGEGVQILGAHGEGLKRVNR